MNKKGRTRNWVALLVLSLLEFEFYLAIVNYDILSINLNARYGQADD